MLKLEDIRFPITFISRGVGTITFESATARGIRDDGTVSGLSLAFYIKAHNEHNHKAGDYAYKMAPAPVSVKPKENYLVVAGGEVLATPPQTFTEALDFAKDYAVKHRQVVRVVAEVATVSPKVSTTAEVVYA